MKNLKILLKQMEDSVHCFDSDEVYEDAEKEIIEDFQELESQLANALALVESTNSDMLELNGKLQEFEGMKKFIIESAEKLKGGTDET